MNIYTPHMHYLSYYMFEYIYIIYRCCKLARAAVPARLRRRGGLLGPLREGVGVNTYTYIYIYRYIYIYIYIYIYVYIQIYIYTYRETETDIHREGEREKREIDWVRV